MMELQNLDLGGAPYAYTPFCESRKEMDGFRFWKQGYWKNHLQVIFYMYLYLVFIKYSKQYVINVDHNLKLEFSIKRLINLIGGIRSVYLNVIYPKHVIVFILLLQKNIKMMNVLFNREGVII